MTENSSGNTYFAPAGPAGPAPSRRAGLIVVGILLLVAVLAGGAASAVTLLRDPVVPAALPGEPTVTPQEAARLAACEYARTIATLHYNDLDDYFDRMRAGSTGKLRDQYDDTSDGLRRAMTDIKATSTVEGEPECLSKSGAGDEFVVFVVLTQRQTSTTDPDGRSKRNNIEMTMRKVGDRWLCADLVVV